MKSNNDFHLSSKLADHAKRNDRSQDWSFLLDTVLPRLDWLSDGGKRRLVPGGDSSLGGASIVVADYISFATIFYALHQKSSLIHSVAPPPQIEPASLGFNLVIAYS